MSSKSVFFFLVFYNMFLIIYSIHLVLLFWFLIIYSIHLVLLFFYSATESVLCVGINVITGGLLGLGLCEVSNLS